MLKFLPEADTMQNLYTLNIIIILKLYRGFQIMLYTVYL